jgi:hypothetical protein
VELESARQSAMMQEREVGLLEERHVSLMPARASALQGERQAAMMQARQKREADAQARANATRRQWAVAEEEGGGDGVTGGLPLSTGGAGARDRPTVAALHATARLLDSMVTGRGSHSSTFQLNLSRF